MPYNTKNLPPNNVPFGSIRMIVGTFLDSRETRLELDMKALGLPNPPAFYNSCFQTAKRTGLCRAHIQGSKIIFERMPRVVEGLTRSC